MRPERRPSERAGLREGPRNGQAELTHAPGYRIPLRRPPPEAHHHQFRPLLRESLEREADRHSATFLMEDLGEEHAT